MYRQSICLVLVAIILTAGCDIRRENIMGCERETHDGASWYCHINKEDGIELYECPPHFDKEEMTPTGGTAIIEQCIRIQPESDAMESR